MSLNSQAESRAKLVKREQPSISITLETFDQNQKNLGTFSITGDQKQMIKAEAKNATDFVCDLNGEFETLRIQGKNVIKGQLIFECGSPDKTKSKVIGVLIDPAESAHFNRWIFLHKQQPKVSLKIKELNL